MAIGKLETFHLMNHKTTLKNCLHCRYWVPKSLAIVVLALSNPVKMIGQTTFTDVTKEAGIDHQFKVYEGLFGGGACVFDLNNDGFEDLYIASGMNEDVLYLNNGDGTFRNIYEGSGLEVTRHYVTQGAAAADVNRDGWVDLFITTITTKDSVKVIPREKNLLFLNNGNSTFSDVTLDFGIDQMYSFSTGANFGDFNADGYPDLFVGNYFLEYEGELDTIYDATIVNSNKTAKDYMLLNRKGRSFTDVYGKYGLKYRGFGFGGVFTDFDNDSDQDLIVMNDFGYKSTPNFLFENRYPRRSFHDVSEDMEMDLKINSMGTAVGDFNGDGLLDYFMTNIRGNYLMVNQGPGQPFLNRGKELKLTYHTISWGTNFADFDHDGDVDLFVANGDLNPNCVPMVNQYFENENGRFTEKAAAVGLNDYGMGRGSVVFDMENDGDLDILVINQEPILDYPESISSVTRLYRNDGAKGNWLKVALQGVQAEKHGIGSRVEVVAGHNRMIREIDGGSSHASQNSTIAHFGLGQASVVDSVIVTWLGGKKQILTAQGVNTLLTVVETEDENTPPVVYAGVLIALSLLVFLYYRSKATP
jgi:hypothetical protein